MSLKLYAMTCGWVTMPMKGVLEGVEGTLVAPIPSYLIEHPKGRLVFDTGLHIDCLHDKEAYLGPMARVFKLDFEPGEELGARLGVLDLAVDDIDMIVTSHLHFDHAGGNSQLPNARVVVQQKEWAAGKEPDLVASNGYKATDYDLGHDIMEVDGEHDIFGDGSVVCLPTHGHTPGHQSLKVRLASGQEVVLAGDACYLRRTLEELHLPKVLHDRDQTLASLHKLRDLQDRGARIFYGHDPDFWQSVPQAPALVA